MTYTIEPEENNITAYRTIQEALANVQQGDVCFATAEHLVTATANWPISKFVEIWNDLPGVTPVKKFENRTIAAKRIFARLEATLGLDESESGVTVETEATTSAKVEEAVAELPAEDEETMPAAKMAKNKSARKKPAAKKPAATSSDRETKRGEVIAMLQTKSGATTEQIMETTGWQAHTVRGFVATLKTKHGMVVESSKEKGGERTYRIA